MRRQATRLAVAFFDMFIIAQVPPHALKMFAPWLFFLAVFADLMGVWVSLLLGSFLFGLCHLYQGWANVLRTGVIGLVLGIIYVLTESLWVVISLHALMDIFGGVLGYVVHKYGRCESELAMG